MEHKLIQGGEQYLPFARSCIKALRAGGMQYASQRFSMGDAEVNVQIIGNQDYIRLTGGVYEILSGVVRDGELISLPVPEGSPEGTAPVRTLRAYKPTAQAWEYPLKSDPEKSPTLFNDEKRLVVETHPNTGLDTSKSQYDDLSASMYSGLMAKAVQIILGYGTKTGTKVKYDHRWERCHGIAIAEDGAKWLVEISLINGVIARPLPLLPNSAKYSESVQDVLREAVALFGGLPSGGSFPPADELEDAITAGSVVRLMAVAEMDAVFLKSTFSPLLGWAFSPLGDEAQNTCYEVNGSGDHTAYRYKLAITIGPKLVDRPANTPLAVATAVLTLEEQGPLTRRGSPDRRIPFAFAYDRDGLLAEVPAKFVTSDPVATSAPLLVTYDKDGVLDVVKFNVVLPSSSDVTTNTGNPCAITTGAPWPGAVSTRVQRNIAGGRTISSTRHPLQDGVTGTVSTSEIYKTIVGVRVFYQVVVFIEYLLIPNVVRLREVHRTYYQTANDFTSSTKPRIAGVWPLGARDCYTLCDPGETRQDYEYRIMAGAPDPAVLPELEDLYGGDYYFSPPNPTFYEYSELNAGSFPTMTVTKGLDASDPCSWPITASDFAGSGGLVNTADFYTEIGALPENSEVAAITFPPNAFEQPPVQEPPTVRVVIPGGTTVQPMGEPTEDGIWFIPAPRFDARTSYAVRFSTFGPTPHFTFSYSIRGYVLPGVERIGPMLATETNPAQHTYSFVGYT